MQRSSPEKQKGKRATPATITAMETVQGQKKPRSTSPTLLVNALLTGQPDVKSLELNNIMSNIHFSLQRGNVDGVTANLKLAKEKGITAISLQSLYDCLHSVSVTQGSSILFDKDARLLVMPVLEYFTFATNATPAPSETEHSKLLKNLNAFLNSALADKEHKQIMMLFDIFSRYPFAAEFRERFFSFERALQREIILNGGVLIEEDVVLNGNVIKKQNPRFICFLKALDDQAKRDSIIMRLKEICVAALAQENVEHIEKLLSLFSKEKTDPKNPASLNQTIEFIRTSLNTDILQASKTLLKKLIQRQVEKNDFTLLNEWVTLAASLPQHFPGVLNVLHTTMAEFESKELEAIKAESFGTKPVRSSSSSSMLFSSSSSSSLLSPAASPAFQNVASPAFFQDPSSPAYKDNTLAGIVFAGLKSSGSYPPPSPLPATDNDLLQKAYTDYLTRRSPST